MKRLAIALGFGTVLAGCATQPTEVSRNDDAYTPIGSNIPRRDRKPEERATTQLPPGQYIPGPTMGSSVQR